MRLYACIERTATQEERLSMYVHKRLYSYSGYRIFTKTEVDQQSLIRCRLATYASQRPAGGILRQCRVSYIPADWIFRIFGYPHLLPQACETFLKGRNYGVCLVYAHSKPWLLIWIFSGLLRYYYARPSGRTSPSFNPCFAYPENGKNYAGAPHRVSAGIIPRDCRPRSNRFYFCK